jgi:type IV pilus assembly protein PilV
MMVMSATQKRNRRPAALTGERGFAILEALVAMLVFAFGILGLVGVQASMTREQTAAKLRSDAAYLAGDLIATMWGDVANITNYSTSNCASYTRCSDWKNKVVAAMPSASVAVTVNATSGDVSVTVIWTLPNGDSHQYVTATTIKAAGAS